MPDFERYHDSWRTDNFFCPKPVVALHFRSGYYQFPVYHLAYRHTVRPICSTFRCLKSDLNIRPIHHQNDWRIESHIYLTILAYQLVNTIRYMLSKSNVRYDWQNIVRIMSTQTLQTLELPTETKVLHLRKPAKPIQKVKDIYDAAGCKHTQKAVKKYVVYH